MLPESKTNNRLMQPPLAKLYGKILPPLLAAALCLSLLPKRELSIELSVNGASPLAPAAQQPPALPSALRQPARHINISPDPKNCRLPGRGFLLIDSQYLTEEEAHQRARFLHQIGIKPCTIIWLPCAGRGAEDYAVQVGPALPKRAAAERRQRSMATQLKEASALRQPPFLIQLYP